MSKNAARLHRNARRTTPQSGVALVVALVFLLALTVIGVASLSTATTESRMAYSFGDYNRAFQAAESGIAEGERWLDTLATRPDPENGCLTKSQPCLVWAADTGSQIGSWFDFPWTSQARTYGFDYSVAAPPARLPDHALLRVGMQPAYVIEDIGREPDDSLVAGVEPTYGHYYFRITARGTGARSGTVAIVQSVYIVGF